MLLNCCLCFWFGSAFNKIEEILTDFARAKFVSADISFFLPSVLVLSIIFVSSKCPDFLQIETFCCLNATNKAYSKNYRRCETISAEVQSEQPFLTAFSENTASDTPDVLETQQ